MTKATYRKGDRVVPSGAGRTATWPKRPGTVVRKIGASSWEVQWDGTSFGDEMALEEIQPAPPADLDAALGAEKLDDTMAARMGVKLYPVQRNGKTILVTVPAD
jgi:hypothetical protein